MLVPKDERHKPLGGVPSWESNSGVMGACRNSLGMECNGCGHRGLVPLERIGESDSDMRPLIDRPFECTACGSMFVGLWLVVTRAEADAWCGRLKRNAALLL